ncbi:MAG: hypothetical protein ABEK29_07920 [Bradymonadaceae bacterium]
MLQRRYGHKGPEYLVLDADASDIQLHGIQEGRHYHTYYDGWGAEPQICRHVVGPGGIDS